MYYFVPANHFIFTFSYSIFPVSFFFFLFLLLFFLFFSFVSYLFLACCLHLARKRSVLQLISEKKVQLRANNLNIFSCLLRFHFLFASRFAFHFVPMGRQAIFFLIFSFTICLVCFKVVCSYFSSCYFKRVHVFSNRKR